MYLWRKREKFTQGYSHFLMGKKQQAEPMWGIIAVPYGNRVSVKKYGWNFCQITEKRCQTSVEIEKEL